MECRTSCSAIRSHDGDRMWHTPLGERTIVGAEASLLREAIGSLWDDIESEIDDPNLGVTELGVQLFDELAAMQKLAMLAEVGEALLKETPTHPELTSINEAAIAAIYLHIEHSLDYELDLEKSIDQEILTAEHRSHTWRGLLLAAADQIGRGPLRPGEPVLTVDCRDRMEWMAIVEMLTDSVLWDLDYEDSESYVDKSQEEAEFLMNVMSIDGNYFRAIPPDPLPTEANSIRLRLRALVGSNRGPLDASRN